MKNTNTQRGFTQEVVHKNCASVPALQTCTMTKCAHGFTLIELLVVVLIIGVLAAVALPQYNKAVRKSRLAGSWNIMASLKAASQACSLREGRNCQVIGVSSDDDLDIDVPTCQTLPGENWCHFQAVGNTAFRHGGDSQFILILNEETRLCGPSKRVCEQYGISITGDPIDVVEAGTHLIGVYSGQFFTVQ